MLVAEFKMGTRGAVIATVLAQLISVLISLWIMQKKTLLFYLFINIISVIRNRVV